MKRRVRVGQLRADKVGHFTADSPSIGPGWAELVLEAKYAGGKEFVNLSFVEEILPPDF